METLELLFVLLLGLAFGSFANVLIYRLPKGLKFTSGRSFCPRCKKNIEWRDNVPILSYLVLRGNCRKCGRKISLVDPSVEPPGTATFCLA